MGGQMITEKIGTDTLRPPRAFLAILLEKEVMTYIRHEVPSSFTLNGTCYRERQVPPDEPVFYDWLLGANHEVVGLEIHVSIDDAIILSKPPLCELQYVTKGPFPQIWLTGIRHGIAAGLEAFGDIAFFASEEDHLAIVVGVDQWICPAQLTQVKEH